LPIDLANVAVAFDPAYPFGPRDKSFLAAQTAEALDMHLRADSILERQRIDTCILAPCLLTRRDVKGDYAKGVEKYALQVERDRVSVKLPPPTIKGKPATQIVSAQEEAEGWVPLFDGKSLEGWTTLTDNWGGWSVQEGELKCAGTSGPWIRTVKRYGSFALRLQFNISPNGNSGVFIRAPYDARCSRFGMEVQILGTHKDKPDKDTTGAIYSAREPLQDAGRPAGQWNDLEIICDRGHVTVRLNNQMVQDFHMDAEPALKGRLTQGCIGLQDHGNLVSFRNIRIKGHVLSSSVTQ
jgi:hypothetical protein